MFIRKKKIKGREYAYLVENKWTEKGTRQKVSRYLGKVLMPERRAEITIKEHLKVEDIKGYAAETGFKKIISDLVAVELFNHGVKSLDNINGVLQINEGFLCRHTVNELLNYAGNDESGIKLAELITGAGIKVEKDLFISLFDKGRAKSQQKQAEEVKKEFQDFYY